MNQHIVYLDCDQVLTDFIAGAAEAIGYDYPGTPNWPEGWTYDFFPYMGSTREEVNTHCNVDLWANLPWMEDGKDMLNLVLSRFRPDEIIVLTTPMQNNESYTGKMIWFERNVPELYHRVVPTLVPKDEFAFDFNRLLIDDCQSNYEKFTKAGGACILVPRPWNANEKIYFAGEAVSYVAEHLDKWMDIVDHPARNRKEING